MKLRCAIIDDELLARKYIAEYINKVPYLELIGDYNSPLKIINEINNENIDLLFLDIQMPNITGIEFLKSITKKPLVIFTTAYSDYALEGYKLNVIDYLLKPFSFDRFLTAVNKVKTIWDAKNTIKATLKNNKITELHHDYIVVRADRKLYKINFDNIITIEGQKAYVTFHTIDKNITALCSMKELSEQLPEDKFIRIHKSFITNVHYIEELEGNQVKINKQWYPVGKSYKQNINKVFGL